ncbi:hypothetical protein C1H76_7542 [Elsinoe australis]|uniref:Uncharacterized protein n=1 Tax=Elsinoe australis TaxID=40998 RepID=A0A4U7AQV8_9PEZI|nr:hypothetical protein C1H76_7542 [Elsinoe australis]
MEKVAASVSTGQHTFIDEDDERRAEWVSAAIERFESSTDAAMLPLRQIGNQMRAKEQQLEDLLLENAELRWVICSLKEGSREEEKEEKLLVGLARDNTSDRFDDANSLLHSFTTFLGWRRKKEQSLC